ncbi:MAG TPA: hypothetical protein VHW24_09835, partial [Bryobacteraceae bacterium]|nr:hypothetical protein [Bryobacteraceae bacterium]
YAATPTAVYKSTDGAAHWNAVDATPAPIMQILIDGQNTNIIYEVSRGLRKAWTVARLGAR